MSTPCIASKWTSTNADAHTPVQALYIAPGWTVARSFIEALVAKN